MSQAGERFGGGAPRSVNEALVRDWLRHAHYLERFSEGEAAKIRSFLRSDVLPEIVSKLTSRLGSVSEIGYDPNIRETQRWQKIVEAIERVVDDGMQGAGSSLTKELERLSKYEAAWQAKSLSRAVPVEIGIEWSVPSPEVLRQLVSGRPIVGATLDGWMDKLSIDTADRISREVRIGLAEGQSIPDIAQRITGTRALKGTDGVFEVTARQAQTIARTASANVGSQARQATFAQNARYLKGEQWIATLDLRTCPVCGSRDGKAYPVGEGPMPPAHPQCRCARMPIVKSLSELGIRGKRNWSESTRASMNGEVPESMTYSDWLGELPSGQLSEALGPARARAFSSGALTVDRMVDQSGRALSLDAISRREGIEF